MIIIVVTIGKGETTQTFRLIIRIVSIFIIKLRMEMGNVPKRQQPDHKKTTAEGHPYHVYRVTS